MSDFSTLFRKYIDGTCTAHERQALFDMIAQPEYNAALQEQIDEVIGQTDEEMEVPEEKAGEILSLILHTRPAAARRRLFPVIWKAAAAVLLLLAGGWWYQQQEQRIDQVPGEQSTTAVAQEIRPAASGAVLTLADGRTVSLDSMEQGLIARQHGTAVKLASGTLAYEAGVSTQVSYNTLTTPRGKLFHLVLPDGSGVWLNAGSSIRYPTVFTGEERMVELKGEAYFEIRENAAMPFKVKAGEYSEIRVLGTGFNINAYENEDLVKATLLHGSVEVKALSSGSRSILQPGEQAGISPSAIRIEKADTSQVMAWKRGIFNFDNAGIASVMKQLERWYDIDVVYEKGIPDIVFGGKMKRDLNLSQVLRILEISKVNFRQEGRTLIVYRK